MSRQPNEPDPTTVCGQPTGTGAQPPIPPPTPPVLPTIPGYEILERLDPGGMGVVYKARQLGFNRIVALKMILSGSHAGAEERERFRIEAEAVASLKHAHIVHVYEVGEHEGQPFFSMEFCPGGGLNKKLNGTPMPPAEAAQLVEKLARAVQEAHEKGVIHRDLKPANVLLDEHGTPKVVDFGLAKRMDAAGKTQSGVVMGTLSYMAAEQAAGKSKEISPRTDVYALGAILYECLTGRPPFNGPTFLDTLNQVLFVEPKPPRQLQRRTPRDLEAVVLRCLEKEPARRYATAHHLAEDLQRFLDGKPVDPKTRSIGPVRRMMRQTVRAVRRRPGLLTAVLASVILGLAAGFLAPRLLNHDAPVQATPVVNPVVPGPGPTPGENDANLDPDPNLSLPPDLALVPPDCAGYVSVRVAELVKSPQFDELRKRTAQADPQADQLIQTALGLRLFGLEPADVDRVTVVFLEAPPNSQSFVVIVATSQPYDLARRPLFPVAMRPVNDRLFLVGPSEAVLQEFSKRPPTPRPAGRLAAALRVAALPECHAVIALNDPSTWLKEWRDLLPPQTQEVWPAAEAQAASLALTLSPLPPEAGDRPDLELKLHGRLTFADASQAERGLNAVQVGLAQLLTALTRLNDRLDQRDVKPEELADWLGGASSLGNAGLQFTYAAVYGLETAQRERRGDTVHIRLSVSTKAPRAPVVDPRWRPDPDRVADANRRYVSRQQLQVIGKALRQYAAAHDGRLPPAERRVWTGRPLLSWRVLLLPYLGQDDLYKQFDLDEPWDGEHNRALLARRPDVYGAPGAAATNTTPYEVLIGKGTAFEAGPGLSLDTLAGRNKKCLLVVEAAEAVPWTQPQDLIVSADGSLPRLGGLFKEAGFDGLFANGSARFFHPPIASDEERLFRELMMREGDATVDPLLP